jgi:signal transduction histidine kinase/CheY-like chemotaxis protein/HPt (histidine-containing phosphotransfer) domain-containing protein
MRSIIKKLLKLVIHAQVIFVFLAFALMVFFSYNFMADIERRHLINKLDDAINKTQEKINSEMLESKTTLNIVSETVRSMIIGGSSYEKIEEFIINITGFLLEDSTLMSYTTGVYAFFDVFNDKFCDGFGWVPPDDFDPKNRPWYATAIETAGTVGITQPFIDAYTNSISITFVRRIFDNNGNPLGIVCMDILLDRVRKYAVETSITEDSYGIMLDKDFNVIAHPHPAYIGKHLSQMNDGVAIQNELMQGKNISERKATDYKGNSAVLFIRRLDNDWYLGILAYSQKYYKSVVDIAYILILLALIFAAGLSAILLSIVMAKKRAEERTQVLLDAVPLCANLWNSNLKLIDCNQEAVNLFKLSYKKEYIDKFFELSPEYQPDGRLSAEKAYEYVRKTFDEGYQRFEWLHRRLNGELIPCEIILVRVKYRKESIVCGYSRDLREIKSMITKIRETDECAQVLFNTTPLSCFMIDNSFKILECNQETVNMLGLSHKNEFMENINKFFPKYQRSGELSIEKFYKYINTAFEEGSSNFEWIYQNVNGEQIPTEVSFVRVKFRGVYAVAGYIRDLRELNAMIAEMRRAEIAEESNRAKSDFLARMSHEIRTPMNAILGITEIQLQNSSLPLAVREGLERIYNSGDLLLGIINDILDLSKIEAGKLELVNAPYEISSLIHDIVKLNVIRYESKPIEFRLDVSENVPTFMVGDELRIKQILNNLISNAFKYTDKGIIELSLFTQAPDKNSGVVLVFRISDTGQGMTPDQVKKLGEKFSRFNLEANRKTEGTGLGMNITRNLVHLMNGNITVESVPGKGSVFTVKLPQECTDTSPIGKELADNLKKLNIGNMTNTRRLQIKQDFMPYGRVLVVDDVETNLYVVRGLLAPYGLSIDIAMSGFEAIDKIRGGAKYDIIFMDHMMPKMDGIEAVKIIRNLDYKGYIVALTANAITGQAEVFLNNGFDDFISKPIDIRQLNAVLNKLIRDKQPAEILYEAQLQKNIIYAAGRHHLAIDPQLAEFFVRDGEKAYAILENILKNNFTDADDFVKYIINVHALKSALANIGEGELSDEALELEQAGRDQNTNLILTCLPDFLISLRNVIDKLKPPEEAAEETQITSAGALAFLQEKLLAVQAACVSFDKKSAKEILAEVREKTWSKDIRDKLSAISERLLHSEFEEAAAIARELYFP